jgi:hypothetical protein
LDSKNACFEIVHFAFVTEIAPQRQSEAMQALGGWVATQPGFVSRHTYQDAQQGHWTDVVEWASRGDAIAAMERSQQEPALASVLALIDPDSLRVSHCVKWT